VGLAALQCQLDLQSRNNPPGMVQSVDLMGQESHQLWWSSCICM